jgi:hypothetical protein
MLLSQLRLHHLMFHQSRQRHKDRTLIKYMNKHQKNFQRILEYKQRFQKLSTKKIRERLGVASLIKEAEIAYREILKERGEAIYVVEYRKPETVISQSEI